MLLIIDMVVILVYSVINDIEDLLVNVIVVIGMGCKFFGVELVEEYWKLLDFGLFMVIEVLIGCFFIRDYRCSIEKFVFLGNFFSDIEYFDNWFFKKLS